MLSTHDSLSLCCMVRRSAADDWPAVEPGDAAARDRPLLYQLHSAASCDACKVLARYAGKFPLPCDYSLNLSCVQAVSGHSRLSKRLVKTCESSHKLLGGRWPRQVCAAAVSSRFACSCHGLPALAKGISVGQVLASAGLLAGLACPQASVTKRASRHRPHTTPSNLTLQR